MPANLAAPTADVIAEVLPPFGADHVDERRLTYPEERPRFARADERLPVNITLLRRFVAVAEELHFPRAADALGIPLASLYSSIEKLETEIGQPLFTRHGETQLTKVGLLFLDEARREIAATPAPEEKPVAKAGGKAKASKGKGRAPIVKGQPKPYKKRQGR
jgi:hypothetical protein